MKRMLLCLIVLVFVTTSISAKSDPRPVPPPTPDGFPHVDADWYVSSPIRKFTSAVIMDGKGRSYRIPTYETTKGWRQFPKRLARPRGIFVSGRFRGEPNLWFSGNSVWAYASSTLTKTVAQNRQVCAKVDTFYVTGNPILSTSEQCQTRINAWDWVTTPSFNVWSGCTIVGFLRNDKTAGNISSHRFTTNVGA